MHGGFSLWNRFYSARLRCDRYPEVITLCFRSIIARPIVAGWVTSFEEPQGFSIIPGKLLPQCTTT